jgi:putative transposase
LKQALEIAKGTRASALALNVVASRPVFNGSAVLDKKFITLEDGEKSFDLIVKVSCLKRGHRIVIPTRKTSLFNKWKSAGGILKQACTLSETSLVLYFELPDLPPKEGKHLGVDVGVNKLLVDSEGTEYGTKFKDFRNKITRKRLGSKSRKRAQVSRDNYINYVVNQLPWGFLSTLGVEALKNLKRGKQPRRGKSFRKALSPWTYSRMLKRIKELAQENRVCLVEINPAYTSQTCPECLHKERGNRVGEKFHCLACHYGADADFVGARNIGIRSAHQLRVGGDNKPFAILV